ncbi:hypothetical protein, partial [uncultured Treponema sp.]|uniref:hypothetical protein n=1 Tax=uncultured Treponema sp. TaxID=162155 RepID=UPI0025EC42A5
NHLISFPKKVQVHFGQNTSSNYQAIRGREQQLIDMNGGAKSMGGTSGNSINGISPNNPKYDIYMNSCNKEFN